MYAPPGALANAPVVAAAVAMVRSVKPIMIFLISIVLLHVLNTSTQKLDLPAVKRCDRDHERDALT
jgi:hypothetical protein